MLKTILIPLLSFLVFFGSGSDQLLTGHKKNVRKENSGTLEKLIVANASIAMDLNVNRLNGADAKGSALSGLRFDAEPDSFFTVVAFNGELRAMLSGSMALIPRSSAPLPARLNSSVGDLAIEITAPTEPFELVIRDRKTGFGFFGIEGQEFDYGMNGRQLNIRGGRLILLPEFAAELGRPGDAGAIVGQISISATMRPIEVTQVVDGENKSDSLPAMSPNPGTVPGPDVVVGDLSGLAQFGGSSGTQVGLAVGTDSCNFGTVDLNWFANPNNDHPVIPQNLYRMSANGDRMEQIGQSSMKHAFTALTLNLCSLGCNGVGGSRLGSGCSDPYGAGLNSGPNLGSRAWVNPFTGFYPRNDDPDPNIRNNSHPTSGANAHAHVGPSHRILTEISDLNTTLNPGATYYAEAQYITPHEYAWCQSNPGQCNMYNNVSHRRYTVNGTGSPFTFTPVSGEPTVRTKPAVTAWTGASSVEVRPAPGADGVAFVSYKVTNPSPGVWHYEYAVYNQNLDRAIQSFSVPLGSGAILSNIGFHAPPQHPGWPLDGTVGNSGFSSAAWSESQAAGSMTWSTETMAQNPNANAIRWGTMYNFRFDSDKPPGPANATIGFLKTGAPVTALVQAPSGPAVAVTVSGRVTSGGRGVFNARVKIAPAGGGSSRTVFTNAFGYYRIDGVMTGASYTISADSKRHNFAPQTVPVNASMTVDFIAQP